MARQVDTEVHMDNKHTRMAMKTGVGGGRYIRVAALADIKTYYLDKDKIGHWTKVKLDPHYIPYIIKELLNGSEIHT